MGMSQLSAKDQNALTNLCEVLGASFGGELHAWRPRSAAAARCVRAISHLQVFELRAFRMCVLCGSVLGWTTQNESNSIHANLQDQPEQNASTSAMR